MRQHYKSPTYYIWVDMRQRCYNPRSKGYPRYGGRGIKVCAAWRASFDQFLLDMGAKPEGRSLDRIDNNGDYSPENCRWATDAQQRRNTRKLIMVTHLGKTQCLKDWADELGLNYYTLRGRATAYGMLGDVGRLFRSGRHPTNTPSQMLTLGDRTQSLIEWAAELGVSVQTLRTRKNRGWSDERTLTTPVKPK